MDFYESINKYYLIESKEQEREKTKEMERFFIERTRKHISRVQDFIEQAIEFFPSDSATLRGKGIKHDDSKFYLPERQPYILLTWKYKMKKEGIDIDISEEDSDRIREATFYHVKNNKHHPEYWDKNLKSNPIDKNNREKRTIMSDATGMDDVSIIEMVCDWSAMSVENGEPGPKKWADDSIKFRWKFSDEQQEFIYELIELLWR